MDQSLEIRVWNTGNTAAARSRFTVAPRLPMPEPRPLLPCFYFPAEAVAGWRECAARKSSIDCSKSGLRIVLM
jgi:hypothetical protein